MRASRGTSMRPSPNGQMPAMARMSSVLPVPDGPEMATRSPWAMVPLASSSSLRPSGSSTRTPSRRSVVPSTADTLIPGRSSRRSSGVEALGEGRETLDVRPPAGDLLVGEHEPRQGPGDLAVRDADLDDAAERDEAREVGGRRDQDRNQRVGLADAARQQAQVPLRAHELPPVGDEMAEAGERVVLLDRLAALIVTAAALSRKCTRP